MKSQSPKPSSERSKRFKAWLKKHRVAAAIIAGAVIVVGIYLTVLLLTPGKQLPELISYKPKPVEKFYSPLTGTEVSDEAAIKQPVTAVIIENSPDARPQSGLKKAGVIYEAVAEGGVTRFLAVYQEAKPELIGPVRSLRMYYLDWATPYQASIAHVGGSPNALAEARNGQYRDIDQFFNPDTYWRGSDRYPPHNVYTNFEKIDALNSSKDYKESTFSSFKRTDGKPAEEPNATSVSVNFSSANYNTSYSYDNQTNTYQRSLAGQPHNDREEGLITPNAIVVLKVETSSRGGGEAYEDITTSGTGQAYIFQNGVANEVTWKKENRQSPLQLVDGEGNPVNLNRGQTWISAVTNRGSVSWQ